MLLADVPFLWSAQDFFCLLTREPFDVSVFPGEAVAAVGDLLLAEPARYEQLLAERFTA